MKICILSPRWSVAAPLALVVVCGCQDDAASTGDPQNLAEANADCRVVLREVQNLQADDRAKHDECQLLVGDGFCGWAWRGRLDVADAIAHAGGKAGIRYHADWDGPIGKKESWHEVFVRPSPVTKAG